MEDSGSGVSDGNKETLVKYGFGGGLRYQMPNFPLFLASRFFYQGGKTDRFQADGFDLEMRERWKAQFLVGWTVYSNDSLAFALLAGITLARIRMDILSGGSLQASEKEIQVNPTFGAELAWRLQNARNMYFVLGMTAAIMNSITHQVGSSNGGSNGSSDQFIRADGKVQWDTYAGIRVAF